MDLVIQAPGSHGQVVTSGAGVLATIGGVGWLSTQNVAWLLPLLGAGVLMAYSTWLNARFKRWEMRVKAEERKAAARKAIRDTGETAIPHGLEPGDVPDSM